MYTVSCMSLCEMLDMSRLTNVQAPALLVLHVSVIHALRDVGLALAMSK